jgi:hypothetical protein
MCGVLWCAGGFQSRPSVAAAAATTGCCFVSERWSRSLPSATDLVERVDSSRLQCPLAAAAPASAARAAAPAEDGTPVGKLLQFDLLLAPVH